MLDRIKVRVLTEDELILLGCGFVIYLFEYFIFSLTDC